VARETDGHHDRPAVLFITGHLPYPPVSGGRRRELELITRLAGRYRFRLLVASKTFEEDQANAAGLRGTCDSIRIWPAGVHPLPAKGVPDLARQIWSPELAAAAKEALAEGGVDVVHVERFQLMSHIPTECLVPLLLVEQNVEYDLWHQRMKRARGRRRQSTLAEYASTVQAEIEAWHRADMLAAVTEEDKATMLEAVPGKAVHVIPHGVDLSSRPTPGSVPPEGPGAEGKTILFLANFAYAPNADGAVYLCKEILPRIRTAEPSATLFLVGNDPPPEVHALAGEGVRVTGRVPRPDPFLDAADVVVCPLREGGGIKAKVIEALAAGKAVVTTSIGAQGMQPIASDAMRIEDRPRAFARAVVDLLRDDVARRSLEAEARRMAARLPTWDDAADALERCYADLLGGPVAAAGMSDRRSG
jgi:glycosyltransferase involved in cell wall biosynthesis